MPCAGRARATRAGVPSPPGHLPPYNDTIQNDPCGRPIVATMNGVDVSAESLCLFHWGLKNGLAAVKGAITYGA
jgi:hypothetical protein